MDWYELKRAFADLLPYASRDALHVHLGLLIYFAAIFVFRREVKRPVYALLVVTGLEGLNEIGDIIDYLNWNVSIAWKEIVKDGFHTILWPAVITAWYMRPRVGMA